MALFATGELFAPSAVRLYEGLWVGSPCLSGSPREVEHDVDRLPGESLTIWNRTSLTPQPPFILEPSRGIRLPNMGTDTMLSAYARTQMRGQARCSHRPFDGQIRGQTRYFRPVPVGESSQTDRTAG